MVHVTHAKHALLRRFTGLGVVPRHNAKIPMKKTNYTTMEELLGHLNQLVKGPSTS